MPKLIPPLPHQTMLWCNNSSKPTLGKIHIHHHQKIKTYAQHSLIIKHGQQHTHPTPSQPPRSWNWKSHRLTHYAVINSCGWAGLQGSRQEHQLGPTAVLSPSFHGEWLDPTVITTSKCQCPPPTHLSPKNLNQPKHHQAQPGKEEELEVAAADT